MSTTHGLPCWFELTTTDLDGAKAFYSDVAGWTVIDSGMEEMTYLLAGPGETMTAGMSSQGTGDEAPPTAWLIYIAVDDCDAMAGRFVTAGGSVVHEPTDIPGTGRFAIVTDPQGATIGVLQPLPMEEPSVGAFEPGRVGHGGWIELMTARPGDALSSYGDLFGWTAGEAMDMGEMGTYQLVQRDGVDIGGMMGSGDAPVSGWLAYFNVDGVAEAIERITAGGGTVQHGPAPVPSGDFIAVAVDPQGAFFAVVGPEHR